MPTRRADRKRSGSAWVRRATALLTLRRRSRGLARPKKYSYDLHLLLDPVDESCIRCVALLIEGRLRRQSRWRSKAWRPAAAACNRRLGRQGTPPARHYDLAARSFALRMRRKCRKLKRGPGRKSPRWSAERRASPRHGGAGAFAKAPRRARLRHVAGARHAPERLSALRHPSIGVGREGQDPGAVRRGNGRGCADGTSWKTSKWQGGKRALFLARPFWPNKANRRLARRNHGLRPGRAGFPSGTIRRALSRLAGTA